MVEFVRHVPIGSWRCQMEKVRREVMSKIVEVGVVAAVALMTLGDAFVPRASRS